MHIKSVVIDGFKSYGKRVELKDFDPKFNAITELNGTEKSNILDAICFTLGISTTTTLHAANLLDGIYKSGQAGVQTATVTITFDNRDKSQLAPNYTLCEEIIVSREVGMNSKNTYRINNVIVPVTKIIDFLNSLHMNVNNPHFIITQDKITEVINMKPIEILSMIEEAAGINMYELKKRNLTNTVSKKDGELKEIYDIANKEIIPTFDTIEKEKEMLEELNLVQSQLRNLKEKLDSFNYVQLQFELKKSQDKCEVINKRKEEKLNYASELENKIEQTEKFLQILMDKTDKGGECKLNEIKAKIGEIEKEKYSINYKVSGCESNIKGEEKIIKDMTIQISKSKKNFDLKKNEMEDFNQIYAKLEKENQKNKEQLDKIDKKISSLNSGNIYDDEHNGSVQENINKFNIELQNQQTDNWQYVIKVDCLKKKLNEHLTGMKEVQIEYDKQISQLATKEEEYEIVKTEYYKVYEELSIHKSLKSSRDVLLKDIHELNFKVESFQSLNPNLFFQYNDPRPNFDRRQVFGLVCQLFKPIDFKYELVLTTLAGDKLYYVVTQDDVTVKDILETNSFPNRMHFIPLNKIESNGLSPNVIKIAQQIGGADKVFPAMSLIKFDRVHLKAMQWVFGQAFVCATKEIASKVCFDNRVKKHCFTLEGDHFNPAGTLTGGANTQRLVLQEIANQDVILSQLQEKKREFLQLDNRVTAMADLPDKVSQLSDKRITVEEELENIKLGVRLGKPHQKITEVNNIKQQIVELEKKLTEGEANEKQLLSKIKELESKMKNAKNILKQQRSEAEQNRKNILAKIESNKDEFEKKKNFYNQLKLELKVLKSEMEEEENQLVELNAEKNIIEKELNKWKSKLDEVNKRYEIELKKLKDAEEELSEHDNRIVVVTNLIKDLDNLTKETKTCLLDYDCQIKKAEEKRVSNQQDFDLLNNKLSDEQKEIAPKLDFTNFDTSECMQKVSDLQSRFDQLSIVDPTKVNNFHKQIQEFKGLQKKLDLIEKDKFKIKEIIEELDVKKCEHLQQVSDRANIEFGKIFSSVLPGAEACLRQVDPLDINAGLEICVAFNGVWKHSLDELSGGQRSLVALSLVLAMHLFNGVSFYILDKVDAALDLSHTQNIGKMLKQHFKQSQFIIVSLKDDMFKNANVSFSTKFVDGSLAVTRTTCIEK